MQKLTGRLAGCEIIGEDIAVWAAGVELVLEEFGQEGLLPGRIELCVAAGIDRANIIADPGIGFGKTFAHNLELINDLALFHGLGVATMLGVSRKGFLGALTGVKDARARAVGSVSAALSGLARGVQLFRVHDVRQTAEAFAVWEGVRRRRVP